MKTYFLFVSLLLILLTQTCFSAAVAIPLEDLSIPGLFQPQIWNKAGVVTSLSDELPPEIQLPAGAQTSLSVQVQWPQDTVFRFMNLETQAICARGLMPYRMQEVSVWAYAENDLHPLELFFTDANGKEAGKLGWSLNFNGWKKLTAVIPQDWPQPLKLSGITMHSWGLDATAGGMRQIRLAGLEAVVEDSDVLQTPEPRMVAATSQPFGLAEEDGKCSVDVRVFLPVNEKNAWSISSKLLSDSGEIISQTESISPTVEATSFIATSVQYQLPRHDLYRIQIELNSPILSEPKQIELRVAWPVMQPKLDTSQQFYSSMGINTHMMPSWELFRRLGIHWARDYTWGALKQGETAPYGEDRDFSFLADQAAAHNVTVLPVTMGTFRNADSTAFINDAAVITTAFEKLSRAFPKLPYWEIDNEFDYALPTKRFDHDNYCTALAAAAEGLKRAGGQAKLIMNGTAGIHYEDTVRILNSPVAEVLPAINYHFYTGTQPPETAVEDVNVGGENRRVPMTYLQQLDRINRAAKASDKEAWLTEIGWDVTNGPAVGEKLQGLYLPRVYLLARLMGTDKVFWFWDRDIENADGIFSTCGLYRLDNSLRPSALTMAALSRETAAAQVIGSLDFGEDIWAVLLQQAKGGYTLAIWSVQENHLLPESLQNLSAVDVYGNDCTPTEITPAITYFHLATLPAAWQAQSTAHLLTPSALTAPCLSDIEIQVQAPDAKLQVTGLPAGVSAEMLPVASNIQKCKLIISGEAEIGATPFTLIAVGDGWQRSWPMSLQISPMLRVDADMYEPGQAMLATVSALRPLDNVAVDFTGKAQVLPSQFPLPAGAIQKLAVVPAPDATGSITLQFTLDGGLVEQTVLHPAAINMPVADKITLDGNLADWPPTALISGDSLVSNRSIDGVSLGFCASDEGLAVCLDAPAQGLMPGVPDSFWSSTNLEIFCDPTGSNGGWSPACRQLFLVPVQDENEWNVQIARWDRLGGGVVRDMAQTGAVQVKENHVTSEWLIPWETFGGQPKSGATWRLAIASQVVSSQGAIQIAWPCLKDNGLLDGPVRWGKVNF